MRSLQLLAFAFALAACGDSSGDAGGSDPASGATASVGSGTTYNQSLEDSPCDLLPPAMAAEALGVAESDVVFNERAQRYLSDMCAYTVTGSDQTVFLKVGDIRDDAESAANSFSGMYRVTTEEELGRARDAANAKVDEMVVDGSVSSETADGLDAGGFIASAASKMNYTTADVGDQSVISRTSQLFDGVHVRDGNLIFTVLADVSAADMDPRSVTDAMIAEAERNVQPSLALARAIIAAQ